ncbi:MAG TPA: glycosyltransferase [Candidatus Hydrogenedentes bacterium]|nr:glycosyltransferase [Candidatus Hydrogenedentota bacterium]
MAVSPISVAMIVRDEVARLESCVANLRTFAGEIVVVDTGSQDETSILAERLGCRVGHYPWNDDFSAARNYSLSLCSLPWIYVADADEWLDPESARCLLEHVAEPPEQAWRIQTITYTDQQARADARPVDADDPYTRGYPACYTSWKVRLFPNRAGIRFTGRVHELVNPSLESMGVPMVDSPAVVRHYPLWNAPRSPEDKAAFYLDLNRRKVAESPEDASAQAELGAQLAELGRHAEAVTAYREALRRMPEQYDWLAELGGNLALCGMEKEAEQALRLALRGNPTLHHAWRNLGVMLARRGAWSDAAGAFAEALRLVDRADYRQLLEEARKQADSGVF